MAPCWRHCGEAVPAACSTWVSEGSCCVTSRGPAIRARSSAWTCRFSRSGNGPATLKFERLPPNSRRTNRADPRLADLSGRAARGLRCGGGGRSDRASRSAASGGLRASAVRVRPAKTVVLTTPNQEYNVFGRPSRRRVPPCRPSLRVDPGGVSRLGKRVAEKHGYRVSILPVGPETPLSARRRKWAYSKSYTKVNRSRRNAHADCADLS